MTRTRKLVASVALLTSVQISVVAGATGWIAPPSPLLGIEQASTLREALVRAGFSDALARPGAPPLDRQLTSSDFGQDDRTFVCGCYFDDELKGERLGPLHMYRFDRGTRVWQYSRIAEAQGS